MHLKLARRGGIQVLKDDIENQSEASVKYVHFALSLCLAHKCIKSPNILSLSIHEHCYAILTELSVSSDRIYNNTAESGQ